MILFILLYLSLIGIVGLFALKAGERRQGKIYAALMRERSDAALEAAILWCVREYRYSGKEHFRALAREGFVRSRAWLSFCVNTTEEQWRKLMKTVQGRRERKRTAPGSVSSFLKQLSDHKKGNGSLESERKTDDDAPV